jgi:hypothetical protein
VNDRLWKTNDWEEGISLSACRPIQGAPLRVRVHHEHSAAVLSKGGSNMNGEGSFTDAAFLVEEGNNHGLVLRRYAPTEKRKSASSVFRLFDKVGETSS